MNLRDQLQAIYDKHGRLTPQIVVDEARSKTHPLHAHVFDRPKGEAAEAWYRHRAHELITSISVKYADSKGKESSVRAFLAVRTESPDNGGYVYEPNERVAGDPFMQKLVLAEMERDWRTLKSRYEAHKEFWTLVATELEQSA